MPKSYDYTPPSNPPAESRRRIIEQFDLWRRWAQNDGIIGAVDFPVPPKVGGVAATCRFVLRGQEIPIICDTFGTYDENLSAVALAIQGMRLNEVRGIADTVRQAYAALPPPDAPVMKRDPYEVLGIAHDQPMEVIDAVYRAKAQKAHPDKGGTRAAWDELQDAYERIKAAAAGTVK
jgi:hypothetical protein